MDVKIFSSIVNGDLIAISSKSYAHRLLIAAACAHDFIDLRLNILSADILSTMMCLSSMGAEITLTRNGAEIILRVKPIVINDIKPKLDCGESGSTARFILPLSAVFFNEFTLTGSGKLPTRPFTPLCLALQKNGCEFSSFNLPFTVRGKLNAGGFAIAGDISSQFLSGLLFALPLLNGDSEIELTSPLQSAGYAQMTQEVLSLFNIAITENGNNYFIRGGQKYLTPPKITVEGDWSNGAYLLCMGAVGGAVTLRGLNAKSLQRDRQIRELLSAFGAEISGDEKNITVKKRELNAIDIDVENIPDLVPALAAVAAVSKGTTRIYNGQRLRLKESDRIFSTYSALTAIGANIEMTNDGLIIHGKSRLRGGTADSFNDHRIVMALAIAGLVCDNPIIITNAEAINKSYPTFWTDCEKLGVKINAARLIASAQA